MISDSLPLPLTLCFLANRVVLALTSFPVEGRTIDKTPLEEARDFMADVLHGMDLVSNLKLDARAVETSKKYGKALRVMRDIRAQATEKRAGNHDLEADLNEYVKSIDHLLDFWEADKVDNEKLEDVKGFFEVLRDVTLEESVGTIEKVSGF